MFSISTLWDGVIDPLIGTWMDRSRARGTLQRTWMWRASVPLALLLVVLVLAGDNLPLWLLFALLPTAGWLMVAVLLVLIARVWPRGEASAAPLATSAQPH
jgi:Na+/melibiose symporter-like transporter